MIDTNTFDQEPIGKQSGLKQRIAVLTSNILNPFLLCLALIMLFSFTSSASTSEAFKWAGISAGLGIMPVFLLVIYLLRHGKIDDFFIAAREQRTMIYFLGFASAAVGCITLFLLGAPRILIAGFVTGVTVALIFAFINLWWKISLHTAIVAASATIMVMLYGWIAAGTLALVPLTAWSRIELEYHSLTQTVSGAVLAALLVLFLFQPLSMV
jgi:membrane-associated phospholipid phosphatase